MKEAAFFILLGIVVVGTTLYVKRPSTLFKDGKSDFSIVLCSDASESEQKADRDLQYYFERIGGVVLPIIPHEQLEEGQRHIYIGFHPQYGAKCKEERPDSLYRGYNWRTVDRNLWIFGDKDKGTLQGVYYFLQWEFDVQWHTPDSVDIPTLKEWTFKNLGLSSREYIR